MIKFQVERTYFLNQIRIQMQQQPLVRDEATSSNLAMIGPTFEFEHDLKSECTFYWSYNKI